MSMMLSPGKPNILLVDDHPLMRGAIASIVQTFLPSCELSLAGGLRETEGLLAQGHRYHFILLDLNLPDSVGAASVLQLLEKYPDQFVVAISADSDPHIVRAVVQAGAQGFIPKTSAAPAFAEALECIMANRPYLPAVYRQFLGSMRPVNRQITIHKGLESDDSQPKRMHYLTDRQQDVLQLILRGMPNKSICRQLRLAEGTVKVHVSAVFRVLGVKNRTEAVIAAARMGVQ